MRWCEYRRTTATMDGELMCKVSGASSSLCMAQRLPDHAVTMKIRPLDSSSDSPARTARVVSDPHGDCFVLVGHHALRASDRALNRFEVTSATDAEREALLRARTRLRGLRPRLMPLTKRDSATYAR